MAKEKTIIQIGDEVKELKGAELEAFETDRQATVEAFNVMVAEVEARQAARLSALQKLGLTEEEINAIF
jgi:hypothetical protein